LGAAQPDPLLRHCLNWTRMSMSGALAYRTHRSEAVFVFQIKKR
jgi:hypothetical protein